MLLRCTDSLSVHLFNVFNALHIEKRSKYTFKASLAGPCNQKLSSARIRRVMGGVLHRGVRALYIHTLQHTGFFYTSDVT